MLDPSPGTSSLRIRRFGCLVSSLVKDTVGIAGSSHLRHREDVSGGQSAIWRGLVIGWDGIG
jgi:hypothetical protein